MGGVVAGLVALSGCGSAGAEAVVTVTSTVGLPVDGAGSAGPGDAGGAAGPTPSVAPLAAVTASPAFGTTDLAPNQPVWVRVAGGVLDTLTMTAADGSPGHRGDLRPTAPAGRSAQKLAFGADVHGHRDRDRHRPTAVPITGTFATAGTGHRRAGHRVPR